MSYEIQYDMSIPGRGNLLQVRYILAHESGNANNNKRGSIYNEVKFMKANQDAANVTHWVGVGYNGEPIIIQLAPVGKRSWGCVDANPYCYAQIELARANNQADFNTGYKAYVWLLRMLAKEAGLPVNADSSVDKGIKTHKWASDSGRFRTDHQDPYAYLAGFGISKAQFQYDIANGIGGTANVPVTSTPTTTVSTAGTKKVRVNTAVLNVRSGAGANYKINTQVKSGEVYTITETVNGWGRLKSGAGWISMDYVVDISQGVAVTQPVVKTPAINVWHKERGTFSPYFAINVRSHPNTTSTIVAQYAKGETVNYDSWMDDGNYVWIHYISVSGVDRYMVQKENNVAWGKIVLI